MLLAAGVNAAAAGSIELVSGDLGSAGRALDNIKGSWTQGLKLFGRSTTLSAEYDRNENKDFLSEFSLSGDSGKVNYELTSKFSDSVAYKLGTTTSDGTTLEAEGSVSGLKDLSLGKVSAARAVSLREQDCDLELSHDLSSSESKLKLSTVLGSGIKAIGQLTSKGGDHQATYEVKYDTTLSPGRTLSATVSPADGTGDVEYEDSATLGDATLTAKFPLGGSPKLTVKRAFGF
jgi:hypothetical protein